MREQVVLLNDAAEPIGAAFKDEVHTATTPLHLAFSCWLLSADGQLLITRRALSKKTWPGVWTNSFCGHPAPGEKIEAAIRRRSIEEIGVDPKLIEKLRCVLPDFQYRAVDSSGVVENEVCPVYVAHLKVNADEPGLLNPRPEEIDSYAWSAPAKLVAAADATPFAYSPWLVEELADPRLRNEL
ncbi:isopentenyl-diphosphate Delta-isomerase [Corynebacterium mayonis]|uniref:isopentenyl-diphosphate Delta-isomerase n=1 Tax=Corynebacterium mayonis TaxID=3062461 RepID=UPI0031403AA8